MDIIFTCPNCRQELEADAAGAGTAIECPECGFEIQIPEPTPQNMKAAPARPNAPVTPRGSATPQGASPHSAAPAATATAPAPGKKEHRIALPTSGPAVKVEITRPTPSLEIAAKGIDKHLHIRTFLHAEHASHGTSAFDQAVSEFLQAVGEGNVHAVMPVQYSHVEPISKHVIGDFGVIVYYRT